MQVIDLPRTRIAVVIPFFQREAGLLAAALESVAAQDLGSEYHVEIIVVDDGSPLAAKSEAMPIFRPNFALRIIEQRNAGVSRARNAGLDAVPRDTDYVAFLDSDDVWFPSHLSQAIECLEGGADFYFSNFMSLESDSFSLNKVIRNKYTENQKKRSKYNYVPAEQFLSDLATYCIPHTSMVVYNFGKCNDERFDESFRFAGEDHLFWMKIVQNSSGVGFNRIPTGRRCSGVSLFRETLNWDSPNILDRMIDQVNLYRIILSSFNLQPVRMTHLKQQLENLVGEFVFVAIRMLFTQPGVSLRGFYRLIREMPRAVLIFPSAVFHWRKHRATLVTGA